MSNSNVRVTIQTDKGKWKRRNEEFTAFKIPDDSSPETTRGSIIVMADGQGGNINSNLGAKISVESLIDFYLLGDPQETIENRLKQSFLKVHELMIEKAESFHTPGMVCSLTAIVICEQDIWIAHVGTNRVFQITSKKEFSSLTVENTFMIGQVGEITPVIQRLSLDLGSRILLVSDGITDQVPLDTIIQTCNVPSPSQIVKNLIQLGNDAGGDDNMTACLIEIGKFSKKAASPLIKEESTKKRKEVKTLPKKRNSSFLIWILLILLLMIGIFYFSRNAGKYYDMLMKYLIPGIEKPTNVVAVKPPELPPSVKAVPEASLMVTSNPRTVTVFLYEGEVLLNEKQKNPYFNSESTPALIKGLSVGTYTLIVGTTDYEPYRQVIQIKDTDLNKELPISFNLKPKEVELGTTNPEPPQKPVVPEPPPKPPNNTVIMMDLIVQSEPSNAKIFLNGAATGYTTPNVIKVKPGSYTVQVMKEGYISSSRSVTFTIESSKQTIYLTLKALPVLLSVNSQPGGAKIYLNNSYTGKNTPGTLSLPFGTHTIMVGKAGFEEQSMTITISPGVTPSPILFTLKQKPNTNRTLEYWVRMYEN